MMRTLALTVAYDGTDWAGFQRQTRFPSIQGALEEALSAVLQHQVDIAAAGRTDAGVHALAQVISLRTANPIPLERVPRVTNRLLPASISIRRVVERPEGFHARWSARSRRYWYIVQQTRWPDPIRGRFRWQINHALDVCAMQAALTPLVGRHDFAALCHGERAPGRTTVRCIQRAQVHRRPGLVVIDVQADAFLHQMVRLLVANLVQIGRGVRPVEWLEELLHSRNRIYAGKVAPPQGLFLMRIGYPPSEDCISLVEDAGVLNNEEFSG